MIFGGEHSDKQFPRVTKCINSIAEDGDVYLSEGYKLDEKFSCLDRNFTKNLVCEGWEDPVFDHESREGPGFESDIIIRRLFFFNSLWKKNKSDKLIFTFLQEGILEKYNNKKELARWERVDSKLIKEMFSLKNSGMSFSDILDTIGFREKKVYDKYYVMTPVNYEKWMTIRNNNLANRIKKHVDNNTNKNRLFIETGGNHVAYSNNKDQLKGSLTGVNKLYSILDKFAHSNPYMVLLEKDIVNLYKKKF
jgi:hypothetical protein